MVNLARTVINVQYRMWD